MENTKIDYIYFYFSDQIVWTIYYYYAEQLNHRFVLMNTAVARMMVNIISFSLPYWFWFLRSY